MPRLRLSLVIVLLLAAFAGIVAGRYYAHSITGVAQAQSDGQTEILTTPVPPAWTDLHTVYLGPTTLTEAQSLDPAGFVTQINATRMTDANQVVQFSQRNGLDLILIDQAALTTVDPLWSKEQYHRGTAFVGLNITPQELGALINDPDFAKEWGGKVIDKPFVTFTFVKATGDPEHIRIVEEANALYPHRDVETQLKLGIEDVSLTYLRGYVTVSAAGLMPNLQTIRLNLDSQNLVKPWAP
jgi:hypothetical protein